MSHPFFVGKIWLKLKAYLSISNYLQEYYAQVIAVSKLNGPLKKYISKN
jgi:hypothetical protein